MKIVFSSYAFAPDVGGIESASAVLAEKFAEAENEVVLITETPGEELVGVKYRVTRRPSPWNLLGLLASCDLLFQNNISLRSLLPALLLGKRVVVVHQTWLRNANGGSGWNNWIKRALLARVTNVAISHAILDDIRVPAPVIGNPYDDQVFQLLPIIARDKELAFVGRLVSDKGVDLLLQAMKILQRENLVPNLTIIGSGPEERNLRRLACDLGLDQQVTFAGRKFGRELAAELNRHQILVVPSRWPEPFGIVALEGIACGCVVIGSRDGGLTEAIGPCGVTFENGNESALASGLKTLLLDRKKQTDFQKDAQGHLAKFQGQAVASAYLELIRALPK